MAHVTEKVQSQKRLVELDVLAGIAIALVVFGHGFFPEASPWYISIRNFIYRFHMPVFMYLSGFLIQHSFTPRKQERYYTRFLPNKLKKFLLPYALLSTIFLFANVMLGRTQNTIGELAVDCLLCPQRGPATFLWYIYVLSLYYTVYPLLSRATIRWPVLALLTGFLLSFLPATSLFSIQFACEYVVYFQIGVLTAANYELFGEYLEVLGVPATLIFCLIAVAGSFRELPMFVYSVFAIPAIHYTAKFSPIRNSRALTFLGENTFVIYLFNTLFIGVCYVAVFRVIKLGPHLFSLFVPVFFCVGLLGPIALHKIWHSIKHHLRQPAMSIRGQIVDRHQDRQEDGELN